MLAKILPESMEIGDNPKPISRHEFVNILSQIRGSRMLTLVTSTVPAMRKKDNPYYNAVTKIAKRNIAVGTIYEKAVNRQRLREGRDNTFKSSPNWAYPVLDVNNKTTPFYRHCKTGDLYLGCVNRHSRSVFLADDGSEIPYDSIEPFLYKNEYLNQGVDNPVRFFTLKFSSVVAAAMEGEKLLIKD